MREFRRENKKLKASSEEMIYGEVNVFHLSYVDVSRDFLESNDETRIGCICVMNHDRVDVYLS